MKKEVEKIFKYQDLKVEVEKFWEKKATVVANSDQSPGSNTQRSRKTSETLRA